MHIGFTVVRRYAFAGLIALTGAAPAHAAIFYDWVPDAGSGGSGYLQIDEAFIAASDDGMNYVFTDNGNFIAPFNTDVLLEVAFTFDNGLTIDTVPGFSPSTTVQTDLANDQFSASGGVIPGFGDWAFEYVHDGGLAASQYDGTIPDQILCVKLPCPQAGADVTFSGPLDDARHVGSFVLRTGGPTVETPAPGALSLVLAGLLVLSPGLRRAARRRRGAPS